MDENRYIIQDRISFRDVIEKLISWVKYLISKWIPIGIGGLVISLSFFLYHLLRDPVYTAQTTFVLEVGGSSELGELSSIAGLGDVDLGGGSESSIIFRTDNIVELYRSDKMLMETFYAQPTIEGVTERLITRLARFKKFDQSWAEDEDLEGISFEIPRENFTVSHDSIALEIIEDFRDENMAVDKLNRKLSILNVSISHKDRMFAKYFNEILVENVNAFYLLTKTKKTGENLRVLQTQADSVKTTLDNLMRKAAQNPDVNPLMGSTGVEYRQLQLDIETSGAVYKEILKNLELAEINHRNAMPLIQVIDEPILPLKSDKYKKLPLLVISIFLGGFLMVAFFTLRQVYESAMEN